MEDAVHALQMAFALFVFIIAITYSFFMINQAKTTAEVVFYAKDATNFYQSVEGIEKANISTERIVGIETLVPTLYRYYKENFAVRILDESGKLLQIFDTTVESETRTAVGTISSRRTDKQKMLVSLYGARLNGADNPANLFEAPWSGSTNKDAKTRIDYYVNGSKGYINNTLVDYSGRNRSLRSLKEEYKNNYGEEIKFLEKFIEYDYSGKTITSEDGSESLVDVKGNSKIEIIYQIIH